MMKSLVLLMTFLITGALGATESANHILERMSVDEKIGQMLLVGFRGTKVNRWHEIVKDIKRYHIGSVILFEYDARLKRRGRNIQSPEQLQKLTRDLQSYADIPLFISIDEEGGLVTRLKSRYGFQTFPSQAELGEEKSLRGTFENAWSLSEQLDRHGVNMNFAPVVDVNVNPKNPIIGRLGRSFSADEDEVTDHAREVIRAHRENSVATALKHFPGHGSSQRDSHKSMVDVTETWERRELTPFRDLVVENQVDMIMTAHVYQRHLDPDFPATLSQKIIGGILRQKLGFKGVVISDDMNMKAISRHFSLEFAVEKAIHAGVDILLFGNNLDYDKDIAGKVHRIIKDLLKEGKLSEKRLDESVKRILSLKEARGIL